MAIEIATAYVSITAETSAIGRQINQEFGKANQTAAAAGTQMGTSLSSGMKKAFIAVGGVTAVAAGLKSIVSLGNDFTSTMNTLAAVSGASANQLQAAGDRARELGNDLSLPATSANDAAAAMTELAKGGFTVEQAMTAAKGTLQLAAAAQIDAAQAATIQSQALQAFGLDASNAAMVADTLANAANASSAEITDVAYAFQASGAVANQFGLDVQETASAIAMLANAGIQGSDAGTLLKSALLALTDQSNPAQGAIKDLGLTVYDAAGQFVGLEALFGQLQTAAQRMTPEMYQAATATLFGSDGMRLAGIAAEQGAVGFDAMEQAIGRQGAAAEVAAAKTQGLPGAMSAVGNSVEELSLGIYDLVDGPLESMASGFADFVTDTTPGFLSAVEQIGSTIADLPGPVLGFSAALLAAKATGFSAWTDGKLTGAVDATKRSLVGFRDEVRLTQEFAGAAGRPIGTMQASLLTLGDGATGAGGALGRLRSAGRSVVDFFGGPWAIGIAAAGTLLVANIQSAASARAAQDTLRDSVTAGAKAQAAFSDAVALANGALSDQALAAGAETVKNALSETITLGDRGHTSMETLGHTIDNLTLNVLGMNDAWEDGYDRVSGAIERNDTLKSVMSELKMDIDDVANVVASGGPKYDQLIEKLSASGQAGRDLAEILKDQRKALQDAQEAAKNATPGFATLREAVRTLADESASAADQVDAMKTALDILSGKPVELSDAMQAYNQQVRDTADATADAWDQAQGWGAALRNQDGSVNTATANGDKLKTTLDEIRDATAQAAIAGADMGPIWAKNEEQFTQLAQSAGLSVEEIRTMAEAAGLVPDRIVMLASLEGASTVQEELRTIELALDANAEGVKIPVDALSEEAISKLEAVEGMVVRVDESEGIVFVDAPNEEAMRKLNAVVAELGLIPAQKNVNVRVSAQWDPDARAAYFGNANVQGPFVAPGMADGGALHGGIPGRDSIPILGMPGEHMLTREDVSAMGGQAGVYDFRRALHMATGGAVPSGVSNAIAAARGAQGSPYVWGGTSPSGADCSGWIGFLQQVVMGVSAAAAAGKRLYTTYSLLGGSSAGLKSGLGPAGTWFQVGVNQEHMAGTLAGYAVESGGSSGGPGIGGGRNSAQSGQFGSKFHLPNELVAGIAAAASGLSSGGSGYRSGRTVEWTESDDIDLDKAKLSVDDEKAKRDSVYNDPESSDIDKREADLRVREAEAKAVELQQKKDSAGMPTPEAPGLDRQYSDDEIEYQRKVLAVDEARERRNEIYADIEATENERLQADLDLAAAENALSEVQTDSSGGGSIKDRIKKLGSDLVGIGVDAALEHLPFGLGSTRWLDVEVPDKLVDRITGKVPTTFPQDELDRQMPVTTGGDPEKLEPYADVAPPWIQDWIRNAKVFDQGGWLEPGDIALNLSRRPEPIFNSPEQLAQFAGNALAPAEGDGPSMTFNISGPNPQQIAREVQAVLRLYQMRSGARVMATS